MSFRVVLSGGWWEKTRAATSSSSRKQITARTPSASGLQPEQEERGNRGDQSGAYGRYAEQQVQPDRGADELEQCFRWTSW